MPLTTLSPLFHFELIAYSFIGLRYLLLNLVAAVYLLIRQISPYTANDIVLAASFDLSWLETQKLKYVEQYRQAPENDPWAHQAFKEDDLLADDVVIETFQIPDHPADNQISIVSCYFDSMGQKVRRIDSIHPSPDVAEIRLNRIATNADNDQRVPGLAIPAIQTLPLNSMMSDRKEDQP